METFTLVDGSKWFAPNACSFGDYGGSGSVGLANIRWLSENFAGNMQSMSSRDWTHAVEDGMDFADENVIPDKATEMVLIYGDYSGQWVYLRDTPENRELCGGLDDYPCFDDQLVSQVELEWLEEAWTSWLKSDLLRTLPEEQQEKAEELSDDVLREAFHEAMEECNEYPTPEYNQVHVDIDRIAKSFAAHLPA